jgi:hypothetical protein
VVMTRLAASDHSAIALLCTRAGMIMEDVVADAITLPPDDPEQLRQHLSWLSSAAADIAVLIDAAEVLARRRHT